jgi:hypothetical protein
MTAILFESESKNARASTHEGIFLTFELSIVVIIFSMISTPYK